MKEVHSKIQWQGSAQISAGKHLSRDLGLKKKGVAKYSASILIDEVFLGDSVYYTVITVCTFQSFI